MGCEGAEKKPRGFGFPWTREPGTWTLRAPGLTLLAVFALALPLIVFADNGFVPLQQTPSSGQLSQLYSQQGDISSFINALFKFSLAIGALAAVLRLAYAGYLYMGQADMWSHKGEAKKIIGDVTLGLLLLLGIWLILYQINPDILTLNALPTMQANPAQQAQ